MKKVNRYTSNEFHDWQRANLPSRFVMQDIDTWALVWADSQANFEPIAIIELKRSFYEPEKWTPFKADAPNYLALFKLACKANIPLWVIYFKKDEPITDTSGFHIFKVRAVEPNGSPWISYDEQLITAREFKERFPSIF